MIYGGTGNDVIYGDEDADLLYGEDGNDTIKGGDGGDYIVGGMGNDTLWGGIDNEVDTFVFNAADTGADYIYEFSDATDLLRFNGVTATDLSGFDNQWGNAIITIEPSKASCGTTYKTI